jgi:hypothetical protein
MHLDTITDQWFWLSVAAVTLVLIGAIAANYLRKPRAPDATKPYDLIQCQQDEWIPTGRIDFFDTQSTGNFILHVEETRIVGSIASVEHCQIRWRTATLEEADSVLVAYHAHRLAIASEGIVDSSNVIRGDAALKVRALAIRRLSGRIRTFIGSPFPASLYGCVQVMHQTALIPRLDLCEPSY